MIMVRNTLFQNLAMKLQILSWKILCHLQAHMHTHSGAEAIQKSNTTHYIATVKARQYNIFAHTLMCMTTHLLAEMKGKQRMTRMPIST